jgi:hypothetical protein
MGSLYAASRWDLHLSPALRHTVFGPGLRPFVWFRFKFLGSGGWPRCQSRYIISRPAQTPNDIGGCLETHDAESSLRTAQSRVRSGLRDIRYRKHARPGDSPRQALPRGDPDLPVVSLQRPVQILADETAAAKPKTLRSTEHRPHVRLRILTRLDSFIFAQPERTDSPIMKPQTRCQA